MWIHNTHEIPALVYVICSWYGEQDAYLLLFSANAKWVGGTL